MTYDYNGAWDNVTGVNAPLYPRFDEAGTHRETLNVDFSVKYWLTGGCPAEKLVVGMGTYGRCFTLQSAAVNGLGAPVKGPCMAGTYTRETGFLAYYEICDMVRNPYSSTVYNAEHEAVYTYIADQWVGYDNVGSLTKKVEYVIEKNLGGWMIWNLDLDDFTALHCGAGTYPLSKALNQVLLGEVPTQSATTVPTTSRASDSTQSLQSSTSTTTGASGGTGFCSDKTDGQHANPDSCMSYYNCHAGTGGLTPCSSGLYYDTDKRVCSWNYQLSDARKAECGLA
jgi:chitinase